MAKKKGLDAAGVIGLLMLGAAAWLGWSYYEGKRAPAPQSEVPEVSAVSGASTLSRDEKPGRGYLEGPRPYLKSDDIPSVRDDIVACNEHVEDEPSAALLLRAMDRAGVRRACLMGSAQVTFRGGKTGFTGFRKNNELILRLAKKTPDRFLAFVTLDPAADGNVEELTRMLDAGATGLRLYLGRGGKTGGAVSHVMPLDDPRMRALYSLCEQRSVPVVMNVNLNKYRAELERVLSAHPRLRLMIPHWGIYKNTRKKLAGLHGLLSRYPNLYLGISFGAQRWQLPAFEKMAGATVRYGEFLAAHSERFVFSGATVTGENSEDEVTRQTLLSYRQLLEMSAFRFFLSPRHAMRGLHLPKDALDNVYVRSPERFLSGT